VGRVVVVLVASAASAAFRPPAAFLEGIGGWRAILAVGRLGRLRARFGLGGRAAAAAPFGFVAFQQGVVLDEGFHFLVELQAGELQQPDGLLQLGRQGEMLGKLELEGLFHEVPRSPGSKPEILS
jgi:hypothetical protein